MPKIKNTRRHKAAALRALLQQGPASLSGQRSNGQRMTRDEMREGYNQWLAAEVMPLVNELVPELKK